MDNSWQPADLAEVEARISSEKRAFDPVDLAQWAQVAVPPFKARLRRSDEYGDESVYIVARAGPSVIFFDDAEDEFSGATLDAKGGLKACNRIGELKHALRRFQSMKRPGS